MRPALEIFNEVVLAHGLETKHWQEGHAYAPDSVKLHLVIEKVKRAYRVTWHPFLSVTTTEAQEIAVRALKVRQAIVDALRKEGHTVMEVAP